MHLTEQEMLELAIKQSLEESGPEELEAAAAAAAQEPQAKKRRKEEDKAAEAEADFPAEIVTVPDTIPQGVQLKPDTTVRVRNGQGQSATIRLHSTDTIKRLLHVVAKEFEFPNWKSILLQTLVPKVSIDVLPLDSKIKEHGLSGQSLIVAEKNES